ncbi:MAG: hypothetical protein K5989_07290 [Lachnospiraceae bacterium]|nr:hypothetical protein [Lachnospiraceae bacterium]
MEKSEKNILQRVLGKIQRKCSSKAGMSLSEIMLALIILMLSGTMVVQCVQMAGEHFNRSRLESDAQLLCSTLALSLKDELCYASDVRTDGGAPVYFSKSRLMGGNCRILVGDGESGTQDGVLYLASTNGGSTKYFPLVSLAEYDGSIRRGLSDSTGRLKADIKEFTWDSDNKYFHLRLEVSNETYDISSEAEFNVYPLIVG